MALILPDRVKVRSYTTGTGTFTLEAVVPGFQGFSAVGDGNETFYGINDQAGNWEIGRGTWTQSTNTLTRDTVISSSTGGSKVNFPAGGKSVYVTFPSSLAQSIAGSTLSDSFKTIAVAGQSNVIADSATDTLTLVSGSNISITTNSVSDQITISSTVVVPTDISDLTDNENLLQGGGGGGSSDRLINGSFELVLDNTGGLEFPDGTVQITAYTGQNNLEIDGGNAFTEPTAELEIDGGGA